MFMQDPLLRYIRRARARRSKELARDPERALRESYERSFSNGHDVVTRDPFTGDVQVLFVANPDKPPRPLTPLEMILERKRKSPTRAFKLEVLRNRGAH